MLGINLVTIIKVGVISFRVFGFEMGNKGHALRPWARQISFPLLEEPTTNQCLFTISQRLSPVAISFLPCFCESLIQSHHQSLLNVFQFFSNFLQSLFTLPLLRVCPPFIGGALVTKL